MELDAYVIDKYKRFMIEQKNAEEAEYKKTT